ncbi:MAG: 16S rRNA (adenine(1518)-N(6)/adenine(1519)-N(6))-dimethyltransferase RsmA [Kiritimatiellia bacterium]|jgi:16S rRNA (adenine1518-N6/adenine1519-N6)-dimethyltransferase
MNLTSPRDVVALLESGGIRPNKTLGQNFLIDRNILDAIVAAADLSPDDVVVEVGPGLGALTEALMARCAKVVAIEKDAGLHQMLKERWGGDPRLELIHADALDVDLAARFATDATRLVSNLPYAVGARVVVDAATCEAAPETIVVLLQKEVGGRFIAAPGTPDRGASSIWLQQRYDISLVKTVKPSCFHPRPQVVSSVVKLVRHDRFPLDAEARAALQALTKTAFLHRRKQLAASLRDAPGGLAREPAFTRRALAACGAAETARPEELSVEQWIALSAAWRAPT